MKRMVVAAALVLATVEGSLAVEPEPRRPAEPRAGEVQTYESPILSLLLLPVNLLIKAASVLGPEEKAPARSQGDAEGSHPPR